MPSEMVLDTILARVAPGPGKGALGKWRAPYRPNRLGDIQVAGRASLGAELEVRPCGPGVYASERLSLGPPGKVLRGKLLLPTGLGKSDRPG